MKRFLPLLLTALLFGPPLMPLAEASSASATLTWEAEGPRDSGLSLLLVLESDAQGWSLLDARTAPVAAKVARSGAPDSGPLFALVDSEGRPLAAGRLRVPSRIHGPRLDEKGEVRCVALPLERATIAVRLPLPEGAWELRLLEAEDFAPTAGDALAAALSARPADAGLRQVANFPLADLERKAP